MNQLRLFEGGKHLEQCPEDPLDNRQFFLAFSRFVSFFGSTATGSTITFLSWVYVGVLWRVLVSFGASNYTLISCPNKLRNKSSDRVFSYRNWLKMFWVNAISYTAQMVYYKSLRYLSCKKLIADPVSKIRLTFNSKPTVAVLIGLDCPNPTAVISFVNSSHKSFMAFDKIFRRHGMHLLCRIKFVLPLYSNYESA